MNTEPPSVEPAPSHESSTIVTSKTPLTIEPTSRTLRRLELRLKNLEAWKGQIITGSVDERSPSIMTDVDMFL